MAKHKLVLIGERPLYFFQTYYATIGWKRNKFPSDLVWLTRNSDSKFYYEEKDITAQGRLWEYTLKHPDFLNSIKRNFEQKRNDLIAFFDGFSDRKTTDEDLFRAYKLYIEFYKNYQGEGNAYARLIDRYGMQILRHELQKQKVNDIGSAITALTSSSEESYLAKEERTFWEGILKAKKGGLAKFLRRHLHDYAWVGRSYMEEPALTMSDFKKRLARTTQAEQKNKLIHLANILKHNEHLRKQLLKKYKPNKKTISCANILRESATLKDFIRGVLGEVYYHSDKIFDELEKRSGLHRSQIKSLTVEEFKDIFLNKKKVNLKLIEKRLRGDYVVCLSGSTIKVLYGKEAKKFENQFLINRSSSKLKKFTGRPASSGTATGRVRVIYKWDEMKSFKKGEVLVVNNTNPAFASYLHRVAAIVAAEGGVTVHAAIVSREMKIPCVIGIKDVTRLLKNGDLVHVDANKGTIKKL
ncbi:hypothetical protein A3H10_01070 [Candidatus Uhrbacteria bacterium RIFCSPLOWO2_12_FULL_46_10]|nr:MAG: hypothetical protein A3H10_01070 [Candidatus Uhrbacteria bacterium RIFCSPLOWO2_12_FULL_46_10]